MRPSPAERARLGTWTRSVPPPAPGSRRASSGRRPCRSGGWARIAAGEHALLLAPTGSGKTLAAFLWCIDRLSRERARGAGGRPRPLRLAAEGARRRHRAQPARAARRDPAHRGAPRARCAFAAGGAAHRRHAGARAQRPGARPGRDPGHDPRVAVPDPRLPPARDAAQRRDGDRRRDPRPGADQARRASRALARAPHGAGGAAIPSASASPRPRVPSPRWRASSAATGRWRSSTRARDPASISSSACPSPT